MINVIISTYNPSQKISDDIELRSAAKQTSLLVFSSIESHIDPNNLPFLYK